MLLEQPDTMGFSCFELHPAKHCELTSSESPLMPGRLPVGFLSLKCLSDSNHPTSTYCCTRWSSRKRPAFGEEIGCWRILFARFRFGSSMVTKDCPETWVVRRNARQSQKIPFCTIGHTPLGSRFVYLNCCCSPRLFLISHPTENDKCTSVCAPMRQVLSKHASPLGRWGFPCPDAFIAE